ncbi:chemotaxis protein CheB [Natronobacterium gregoryi]|uniref:protein-glutamate methylesterase n=2 Tax=Natronobacterium gregoryi TaxID=44930 RepID=L0AEB4_NATGS|nr:chemotaxis protein CheB [Natronobacterium gregoryi]AFZ71769.1 chemotaxis response regulator containing a CheY-like receiver domain and a methylesterase domain [Natronobacterium gregoryi SP2]ELY72846.1 chemotaxis-specific methylesterase [Natronobacterium gregoryi SP2]PLK21050.1 chemotaxis response regulator protein-glutamate methylesterase [Natronobacterium gregoryi SP2]SFI88247.1 two-component system, chemotaxis family, response regulator CheB [Natronobacterium gregoryi]
MTRILVVDDAASTRTVLGNALADVGYEVKLAASGRDALERIDAIDPDVVTLKTTLPDGDAVDAIERIMTINPTPVLLLCDELPEETADSLLEGVARDVVSYLEQPVAGLHGRFVADVVEAVGDLETVDASSLALARTAATARVAQPVTGGQTSLRRNDTANATVPSTRTDSRRDQTSSRPDDVTTVPVEGTTLLESIVVVGASTGGPKIAERLLERLPAALDATVLIVQHMPATFTGRFADRLDTVSEYPVREATEDEWLSPGEAVVAPGDADLEVVDHDGRGLRVRLDDEQTRGVQPSIDVTMETAAETVTGPLCGVVLSGMGGDGAAGIEAVDAVGGHTIAQDEATSQVFDIPCQAIATGCVDEVVRGDAIAAAIVDACTVRPANDRAAANTEGETDD